ncbi:MAG: molybdopterin-synthase adenylyltransferase MoeB [Gammaproteobacteria bacterium]|nr:molybdopterin-synthase adenylyltransferase MoeB [Gammaproteobacteria bacterium]MBV9697292.1 molybdopterin-synthase adenylyltransferase MoeB [Gammaproteobacteria bacterium]
MSLTAHELARYQRHLALPELGREGQERLKGARVLIVGAGGLGSPAALYLAAAGCGTLGLIDDDRVELSNLQRQILFEAADLGAPKAQVGAARLKRLNPDISVTAHALRLAAGNARELFAGYDLILDGSDRLPTRYLVNDACVLLGKPLVSAAIHRFEGQLLTYLPGRGPCYRCLFPHAAAAALPSCAQAGVLGVLPGVLGALQATEAIKLIAGIGTPLTGRLLTYDALALRFAEFELPRRSDCAVCGTHPSITDLEELTPMRDPASADIRRLSATELKELLRALPAAPPLIDVRQPYEYEAGHLAGSVNIPLDQLPQRIGGLRGQGAPVFICRSGGRSLAACQMALAAQLDSPANLEGGLMAWAAQVDPTLQVV